ncbi:hypothetical protein FSP39_012256 [Pinctada imbricata]|uniref:Uncharacterized protein n=1 Tax=Pinctada imbricata TaxID=66713 RepID=A0AA88XR84_PINIB|nr:hypothetical protein FSP39_012256 [Pinctada imbricata]
MPAAPRGRNEIPPIYLPSYETKTPVHKQYVISCGESRHVDLTLFRNIWQHTLPHIQIMKPRSDLCFKCQQHHEHIPAAVTEKEKLAAISAFTEHIQQAQNERDFYNLCGTCISKFHHFRFTNELGVVYARGTTESTEQRFDLKRPDVNVTEFLTQYPSVLAPAGLSGDRQSDLYRNVRQFVRDPHELCPRPF